MIANFGDRGVSLSKRHISVRALASSYSWAASIESWWAHWFLTCTYSDSGLAVLHGSRRSQDDNKIWVDQSTVCTLYIYSSDVQQLSRTCRNNQNLWPEHRTGSCTAQACDNVLGHPCKWNGHCPSWVQTGIVTHMIAFAAKQYSKPKDVNQMMHIM